MNVCTQWVASSCYDYVSNCSYICLCLKYFRILNDFFFTILIFISVPYTYMYFPVSSKSFLLPFCCSVRCVWYLQAVYICLHCSGTWMKWICFSWCECVYWYLLSQRESAISTILHVIIYSISPLFVCLKIAFGASTLQFTS